MVAEHQEKSIKHRLLLFILFFQYLSSFFCLHILLLWVLWIIRIFPENQSFNIKKDMIPLTEYSPSFNIPTSSNTCWVLVGYLLGICRIAIYQL